MPELVSGYYIVRPSNGGRLPAAYVAGNDQFFTDLIKGDRIALNYVTYADLIDRSDPLLLNWARSIRKVPHSTVEGLK